MLLCVASDVVTSWEVAPSDVPETHLFVAAHPLQEGNEGHEAVIILGLAQLLHQRLGLFLVQFLAKVGQEEEQLVANHGVVLVFVIQLQDLNEVVESTLVLGVLGSLVDGVHLGLLQHLLALFGLSSDLSNSFEGGVEVAGTEEISGVESINIAISLEVVDIEGEVDGLHLLFLKTQFSHFVVGISSLLLSLL